jgi:hypothetical protein
MNSRLILLIVLLFCLPVLMHAEDIKYAGKINGHMITESDFASALWGHYESFVIENDRKPNDAEWKNLYDKTWENSTKQFILQDAYKKYGIIVTEQEVMDTLEQHVPDMVKEHPLFQDEKGFNEELYLKSLKTDKPVDLSWLRETYYLYAIPQQKLKRKLADEMKFTDKKLKDQYAVNHASAKAVIFPFYNKQFHPVITDESIQKYYSEHRRDFARSPQCDVGVSLFPIQFSHEDSVYAKTKIDSLYQDLMNGESFQLLASKHSMSVSSTKDGDVGYFEMANLPMNVQQQIQKMETGHYTPPIRMKDSWVLYKIDDKTKNLVKLREIRISPQIGENTKGKLLNHVIKVRDLASQLDLEKAAMEYDASYAIIKDLSKNKPKKNNISFDMNVIERAIAAKPGYIFEPIFRPDMHAYLLIQVLKTQPFQELPLAAVQDSIRAILTTQSQKGMAKEAAEQFYEKYKKQDILTLRRSGNSIVEFEYLQVSSVIPTRAGSTITDAILRMQANNSITHPIQTPDGYFIGYSQIYREPDWKYWESEKNQIAVKLQNQHLNDNFIDWVNNQIKHSRISRWYKFRPLGASPVVQERESSK